jgi:hypothetical protein
MKQRMVGIFPAFLFHLMNYGITRHKSSSYQDATRQCS